MDTCCAAKSRLTQTKFYESPRFIRYSFFLSLIVFSFLCASGVFVLYPFHFLWDKNRHSLHFMATTWGKIVFFLNPAWKIQVFGKENFATKNQAVVYVANHQSQVDILAVLYLGTRFRLISKASLFLIPYFGWAMRLAGYVPVKRGNHKSGNQCLEDCAKLLRRGTPVLFFAEGTRSKDGALRPFKPGAFRVAMSCGVPIVPITIDGCYRMLPKGSLSPCAGNASVHVHAPISTQNATLEELMMRTQQVIATQLEQNRAQQTDTEKGIST